MQFKFGTPIVQRCNGRLNKKIAGFTPHYGHLLNRQSAGFTLVELIIATLIFGFMVASLSTLYSTANKHMFQNYRMDKFKSEASVAMKAITSRLQEANRIDSPALNSAGNILAFAVSVDQLTGCYPVNTSEPASWHYFCRSTSSSGDCPSGSGCLYYHTGPFTGTGGGGCPPTVNPVLNWTFPQGTYPRGSYPVQFCGTGGGGAVTLLASFVDVTAPIFSRLQVTGNPSTDIAGSSALVNINLRVRWDPATNGNASRDFRNTGKLIDATLNTTVRVNRAGLPGSGF